MINLNIHKKYQKNLFESFNKYFALNNATTRYMHKHTSDILAKQ
jgi:hypothetical protein